MPLAFTRAVSPRIVECALTHLRSPGDRSRARAAASMRPTSRRSAMPASIVHRLEYLADDPDAVFVEDTAVLLGDHAVITRPGAALAAREVHSTARGLDPYFTVHPPGCRSPRWRRCAADRRTRCTSASRAAPMRTARKRLHEAGGAARLRSRSGRTWPMPAPEDGGDLGGWTLANRAVQSGMGRPGALRRRRRPSPSREDEPFAANVVLAGNRLIMAAGSPTTAARLRERGFTVVEVDLSELQKAEAGGTCMSLIAD